MQNKITYLNVINSVQNAKISLLRDSLLYGVSLQGEAFNMSFNESLPGPLKKIVIEGFIVIPGIVVRRFHCIYTQ